MEDARAPHSHDVTVLMPLSLMTFSIRSTRNLFGSVPHQLASCPVGGYFRYDVGLVELTSYGVNVPILHSRSLRRSFWTLGILATHRGARPASLLDESRLPAIQSSWLQVTGFNSGGGGLDTQPLSTTSFAQPRNVQRERRQGTPQLMQSISQESD